MSLVGSATACTAVGYAQDSSGNSTALAEAWDGSHWSIQSTPAPTGGTDVLFDGVHETEKKTLPDGACFGTSGCSIVQRDPFHCSASGCPAEPGVWMQD